MFDINKYFKISSENLENYECRDLSYTIFDNINFSQTGSISFYRSDFRGSKFSSDIFFENNFDLADFIGNTFINVEFQMVNWGNCEIKNGVFIKCQFDKNVYGDLAIHNCNFEKCTFENEVFHMTMFDCSFTKCKFINCIFDQCSTDNIAFDNCTFVKVEMSTMHAENFEFSSCILRDTYLGACFLGTYMLKNVDISLIKFKYRGEVVNIGSDDYFYLFLNQLKQQNRIFEYLNLYLIINDVDNEYAEIFCKNIQKCLEEENEEVLIYNLRSSLKIIDFYYNTPLLPLLTTYKIYITLKEMLSIKIIPEKWILEFTEGLNRIETKINSFNFNDNYLPKYSVSQMALMELHINDSSFDKAQNNITILFDFICKKYFKENKANKYYKIIDIREGSVIITISTCLILSLLTAKVIKTMFGSFCKIRIAHAETNKRIELIKNSKNALKLEETLNIKDSDIDDQNELMKLYNAIGKDYIISIILKFFF